MKYALKMTVVLSMTPAMVSAQRLTLSLSGVAATHNEVTATNRVDGFGGAFAGQVTFERIGFEGVGYLASMTPAEDPTVPDFTMLEVELHGWYQLTSAVGLEASYMRRTIDPEFAAQNVGAFSIGARLQSDLTSIASMYLRGAFSPIADFNGGGSAGLSYQVGFGFAVGPEASRWQLTAHYDFQRFGRGVRGQDVPIQVEVARLGIAYAVF